MQDQLFISPGRGSWPGFESEPSSLERLIPDRMNPPQATRLQPVVRRVSPAVSTADWPRDVGHSPHEMLIPGNVMDACFTGVRIKLQFFGNGDVSGWRGKRNRPRWKTSTEWQRRETVANHAAGIAPGAPTRSLEFTRCGSSEKRENNRIHVGPRGRNGPLGANVVGERHALPRSCTTFSGGRAFTIPSPSSREPA
jgi:hypothetical protein